MESALKTYLNQMRINGEVHIVEVDSADIEPFPMNHAPSRYVPFVWFFLVKIILAQVEV